MGSGSDEGGGDNNGCCSANGGDKGQFALLLFIGITLR